MLGFNVVLDHLDFCCDLGIASKDFVDAFPAIQDSRVVSVQLSSHRLQGALQNPQGEIDDHKASKANVGPPAWAFNGLCSDSIVDGHGFHDIVKGDGKPDIHRWITRLYDDWLYQSLLWGWIRVRLIALMGCAFAGQVDSRVMDRVWGVPEPLADQFGLFDDVLGAHFAWP